MKRADHHIVQQVLDGSISPDAFNAFQQRMREEPELTKLYGQYALLHHTLSEEFEDQPMPVNPRPVSWRILSAKFFWLVVAAAVVLLAGMIYRKSPARGAAPPVVAQVRFSADAVWEIEGASRTAGESLELVRGATLRLLQGRASISPNPAASALIEGPSTLIFVSKESLHLADGRGRFRLENSGGKLEVSTSSMSAVELGTEFGIETHRDRSDELHVLEGRARMRLNGKSESGILTTGEAARISATGEIEIFPSDGSHFPKRLGVFESMLTGPFVKADWRRDYGSASISGDRIEGENYSIFRHLPDPAPDANNPVLLVSLEVGKPSAGEFHTDGWAGMSLYSKGTEVLFFGDSYGPERTWSLDVKQHIPVILPGNPVVGPKTVTLRYDRNTGDVSLHEGGIPIGPAFCSGEISAGVTFDEIRLGASSSAALAVRSLLIRVGGGQR